MVESLLSTVELALVLVIAFETGLYFLGPDWWQVHFSNLNSFPFSTITNEDVTLISILILASLVTLKLIMKKINSRKEQASKLLYAVK